MKEKKNKGGIGEGDKIQRFTTEDLHLAAYLLCCPDLNFEGVERTDHIETKQFVFVGFDKEIDRRLLDYYNRRADIEPQRYNENTGRLRDLLKLYLGKIEQNKVGASSR